MASPLEQLLKDIHSKIDTRKSIEDFVAVFKEVTKVFTTMKADTAKDRQKYAGDVTATIADLQKKFQTLQASFHQPKDGDPGDPGEPGEPGKDADPAVVAALVLAQIHQPEERGAITDGPEEIRDKLELITDEDQKLSIDAIANLRSILDKLKQSTNAPSRNVGGHGALYTLSDVDMSGITAGQSMQWDGTRWIPFTPSGGGGTSAFGEVPSGSGSSFTLVHTPIAGSVRLYRGGAYQQAGVGNDYTISGGTITLSTALQSGEILLADYVY